NKKYFVHQSHDKVIRIGSMSETWWPTWSKVVMISILVIMSVYSWAIFKQPQELGSGLVVTGFSIILGITVYFDYYLDVHHYASFVLGVYVLFGIELPALFVFFQCSYLAPVFFMIAQTIFMVGFVYLGGHFGYIKRKRLDNRYYWENKGERWAFMLVEYLGLDVLLVFVTFISSETRAEDFISFLVFNVLLGIMIWYHKFRIHFEKPSKIIPLGERRRLLPQESQIQ
ncbi:MAG: hypothetical protein ACTSUE_06085, partial [Promethearchaeota archaeon]